MNSQSHQMLEADHYALEKVTSPNTPFPQDPMVLPEGRVHTHTQFMNAWNPRIYRGKTQTQGQPGLYGKTVSQKIIWGAKATESLAQWQCVLSML